MSTKDIRPTPAYTPCDICGRTLLRGEHAEVFIAGGNRQQVCELCKPRALQEGWIREGAVPDYDPAAAAQDRRRSMFGRRRRTREPGSPSPATNLDEALSGDAWPVADGGAGADGTRGTNGFRQRRRERPAPRERAPRERAADRLADIVEPARDRQREPRQVHAVPTGEDSKVAAAIDAFNHSEHPRTVAGVARSLGAPTVAVLPDPEHASLLRVTVSWELCWYRYEVDLGASRPSVRLDAQGYELSELPERERVATALSDDAGQLHAGV